VNHRIRVRVRVLLVSLALATLGCKTVPLVDPHSIQAAETPAETRAAILRALTVGGGYGVVSDQPGLIVARYAQPGWNMVVAIAYSNEVSLRYVSSVGLDYAISEGVPVIHKGYNERVQRLSEVIASEIAIARVTNAISPPSLEEVAPD
jgi:hypothetical protein